MMAPLSVVAVGFFLGMRHATDADHVIAILTIVGRQRSLRPAAWVGALWGVGHTLTIVLVGAAVILLNVAIPDRVAFGFELAVGVMLGALGVVSVAASTSAAPGSGGDRVPAVVHAYTHPHGDYVHSHPHGHFPEQHPHDPDDTPVARLDRRFGGLAPYQALRPLVVGTVHGLAGSAGVVLLVLAGLRDPQWAVAYLLLFGLGTVAGMVLLTTLVAAPFVYTSRQFGVANRRLQLATGLLSIAFGVGMAWQLLRG